MLVVANCDFTIFGNDRVIGHRVHRHEDVVEVRKEACETRRQAGRERAHENARGETHKSGKIGGCTISTYQWSLSTMSQSVTNSVKLVRFIAKAPSVCAA